MLFLVVKGTLFYVVLKYKLFYAENLVWIVNIVHDNRKPCYCVLHVYCLLRFSEYIYQNTSQYTR